MKSRMTDGETRARPAVAVCCVDIVVALSSRFARQSRVQIAGVFIFDLYTPALPPSREREGGRAGGHPILPPCEYAKRRENA